MRLSGNLDLPAKYPSQNCEMMTPSAVNKTRAPKFCASVPMIRGTRFLTPKLLFQAPLLPYIRYPTARLVVGSVTTSESLVLYVFFVLGSFLPIGVGSQRMDSVLPVFALVSVQLFSLCQEGEINNTDILQSLAELCNPFSQVRSQFSCTIHLHKVNTSAHEPVIEVFEMAWGWVPKCVRRH